ncbi:light harvesting chlorophyll a b-binding protein [Klebsormidium nitens]|uniref:Chlorophyll a-b binding protein, chloroplastic n=1 Tax=Klebsormidium nitens TaxID=105231 RepID=A0A1Y1HIA5_KLENI|nr:light harvesting chlorophyll a b-binding protein [Klebsormidium nitens]|eukprot:GAQ78204.1 light harvesting chlorophyll a b-binding protein [Klebsormidium nitens]
MAMTACAVKASALAGSLASVSSSTQSSFCRSFNVVPKGNARVTMAAANRPVWLPGAKPPAHLDGSLPADRGFDPLKLAEDPKLKTRMAEAEVFHGRTAMLAVVGACVPELLGRGDWYSAAHTMVDGGGNSFILSLPPFAVPTSPVGLGIFHMVAIAEGARLFRETEAGYDSSIDATGIYPGFDPLGLATGDDAQIKDMRTREIKNGRLAMIATGGFLHQALHTGKGPIANLMDHLADPSHNWYFGN